jgi:hypothetical protein
MVTVSDLLSQYEGRFADRFIVPPNPIPAPLKFDTGGSIRPYYGLTCIVWVDERSELFQKLCALQKTFEKQLEEAGLADVFAFLRPESFHMTICDISASSDSKRCFDENLIEAVQGAFEQIGTSGRVISQIRGIGLKTTITALVRFDDEQELKKAFRIERTIKEAILCVDPEIRRSACVRFREFAGHISLAYCVRNPGEEDPERVREILRPYQDEGLGEFAFSRLDLTYFTDMNTYVPLVTLNLHDGRVTQHAGNAEKLRRMG